VISRAEYEDAELLMALREELNHDGNEYSFTDDEILGPFGELHCVAALPPRRSLMTAMLNCWQCKSCATSRWYVQQ
jgi:DNA-binding MltR family transcriptional regulator